MDATDSTDMAPCITTPAPSSVVTPDGRPALGAYRGNVPAVRWDGLAGPFARGSLYRRTHAKAWHYASIVTERAIVAVAIIDVGIASSAFVYVFDRAQKRLLADRSWTTLPGRTHVSPLPVQGASSRFTTDATRLAIDNLGCGPGVPTRFRVLVIDGDLHIDAELVSPAVAPPTLCAIAPIAGGVANATHKSVGFEASGFAAVGAARLDLAGGFGAFDHTSGLLARDTRWRWASASGPGLGLNLVEGFNGPVENVLWLGADLVPVGAVHFVYDTAQPLGPWHIRSVDGRLELTFEPEGLRRQDKDLLLAKSWYIQPFGVFRGTYQGADGTRRALGPVTGVTEDHRALW